MKGKHLFGILIFSIFFPFLENLGAVTLKSESEIAAPSPLDYVVVKIGGITKKVHRGEKLHIVKGDKIVLEDAILKDKTKSPEFINFVGFPGPDRSNRNQDKGALIHTGKGLYREWSIDKLGKEYKVHVSSAGLLHGIILFELDEPTLEYVIFSINGKKIKVEANNPVSLAKSDMIKIDEIKANFSAIDDDVTFKIVSQESQGDSPAANEMIFLRDHKEFGKISLIITDN